jgi:general secretion pathway protein E
MIDKTIDEILVSMGVITQKERDTYLEQSRSQHISFREYVVTNDIVAGEDVVKAYSQKFDMPYIASISEKMIDEALLGAFPIKFLREHAVIPIRHHEYGVMVLTSDPFAFHPIDEVTFMLDEQVLRGVATRAVILDTINRYYPLEGSKEMIQELEEEEELADAVDFEAIKEEDILGMASEAPIIKLVNHILYQAVKQGASDIHIEPYEKEIRVRYRVDGVLHTVMSPPKRAQAAITSRLKIMANLNIAEKRQPQDGRIQIRVADRPIDIRVSVLPVAYGERIVMRLLDVSKTFRNLENLGLSKRAYAVLHESIRQPNGIVLLTGPTGSGKTSTLYSILSELNNPEDNIITVEDPVEYQVKGISQVQVREKIGLTFAASLRSILRQDPDIVMIGEMRDQETAQIAVQASLTGHLVLSTLHTNSAPASITRLIDMGVEPYLIASTIEVIVAQRLVRKLCDVCKEPYTPEPELLKRLGLSPEEAKKITFYKPIGCDACMQTGYQGRLPIFEVMKMSDAIGRLTVEHADTSAIAKQARQDGMERLVDDGVAKIKLGLTTVDEVLAVATA